MCTGIRFTDAKGNLYFGRNLDWSCGFGETVCVVPRGFRKDFAFEPAASEPLALIGMGIVAEGMPLFFDCANEYGLCVAGLNFPGFAAYETDAVAGKTNICAYEVPWWIASNFTTVDEAQKALKDVAIVGKPVNDTYGVSMLHWLVSDARRSIVIEYTADGMHIYDDDAFVLANQPAYPWHRENLRTYMNVGNQVPPDVSWSEAKLSAFGSGFGMHGLPGDFSSPSRFVRAAYFNGFYPVQATEQDNVTRLFKTLGAVSMIKGGAAMTDGDFEYTVYTGGYSTRTKQYYYSTYDDPQIKFVSLDEMLSQCKGDNIMQVEL